MNFSRVYVLLEMTNVTLRGPAIPLYGDLGTWRSFLRRQNSPSNRPTKDRYMTVKTRPRVNTNFCRSIAEVVYPRIITILKSYPLPRDRHIFASYVANPAAIQVAQLLTSCYLTLPAVLQ